MLKILSTVTLVLMLVLSLPAGLIMVSQDAAKGELMYPVKRGLESSVLAVASLTPYTKAFFAVALSNRRYEETEKLLASGENADISLKELVTQTRLAATDINKISSSQQRAKLIADLSTAIVKYDKGLVQAQADIDTRSKISNAANTVVTQPMAQPSKLPIDKARPSDLPQASERPVSPTANRPVQQEQNNSGLNEQLRNQRESIESTRRELEELRKKLEREQRNIQRTEPQPPAQGNGATPPTPLPSPTPSQNGFFRMQADSEPSPSVSPSLKASALPFVAPSPSPSPSSQSKQKRWSTYNISEDEDDRD